VLHVATRLPRGPALLLWPLRAAMPPRPLPAAAGASPRLPATSAACRPACRPVATASLLPPSSVRSRSETSSPRMVAPCGSGAPALWTQSMLLAIVPPPNSFSSSFLTIDHVVGRRRVMELCSSTCDTVGLNFCGLPLPRPAIPLVSWCGGSPALQGAWYWSGNQLVDVALSLDKLYRNSGRRCPSAIPASAETAKVAGVHTLTAEDRRFIFHHGGHRGHRMYCCCRRRGRHQRRHSRRFPHRCQSHTTSPHRYLPPLYHYHYPHCVCKGHL
jgi:hypothetical protein